MASGSTADVAAAAARLLARDGRDVVLQPWQAAYCIALTEGRTPVVPPGCGVGKAWLDTRLREAATAMLERRPSPAER